MRLLRVDAARRIDLDAERAVRDEFDVARAGRGGEARLRRRERQHAGNGGRALPAGGATALAHLAQLLAEHAPQGALERLAGAAHVVAQHGVDQ